MNRDQTRRSNHSRILRAVGAVLLATPVSAWAAQALPLYDGFNYSATSNPPLGTGPSSAVGGFGSWIYQGNNTVEPRVFSGNLSYPGLPPSTGNSIQLDTTAPTGADASRLYFGNVDKANVPTLYYSFVTSIPTSTSNNQNGAYFAGFDNLNAGTAYTSFAGLFVRQDAGNTANIDLGISTSGSANKTWSASLPHDTPLFVVASFTFQGLANLDVFTDPTAVPTAEPGTHTATSSNVDASAATSVSNFFLRGNTGEPQGIKVDEVRIGTTWSDVAAKGYYWDIDGAIPGSGGATPSGKWNGATTNFNSDPTGGGAGALVASATRGDTVLFSAGSDATGAYTVTVSGTQTAGTVSVKNGIVALTSGTLAVARFDVATGASAEVSSLVSGGETSGAVTKVGDGNVTFSTANTFAGGTILSAGGIGIGVDSVGVGAGVTSGALGTGTLTVVTNPVGSNGNLFAVGGARTLGNNIVLSTSPLIISGTNDLNLAGNVDLGSGNRGLRIDNGTTSFTGVISGSGGIVKTGTGTAVLTGNNTYNSPTSVFSGVLSVSSSSNLGNGGTSNSISLNGGTLRTTGPVASAARAVQVNLTSTIDAGDTTSFGDVSGTGGLIKAGTGSLTINSIKAPSLTINAGVVRLAPNGQASGVSVLNTLAPGAAQLDISDNHLVDHATGVGSFNGTNYDGLTGMVASGRAGNLWTGPGIITSQSAAQGTNYTTVGIAKASDVIPATATATAVWAGQTITGTDTLVMYTYGGDANLDGKINVDDYIKIDSGIASGLTGWINGDFNYDGKVNIDDYTTIIDANIGNQSGVFFSAGGVDGGSGVTAVPEPATLGLLSLPIALSAARRRRRERL